MDIAKKRLPMRILSFTKIFSLLLVALLLLLTACGGDGDKKGGQLASETPFIGGNTGLTIKFVPGAPPDEVTDNRNFPFGVSLQIENNGETEVQAGPENGYIRLLGINPVDFGVPLDHPAPAQFLKAPILVDGNLAGARKNFDGSVIPGGQTVVNFPFDPGRQINQFVYVPNIRGNTAVTVRADACYNYATMSTTKLCVKQDLLAPTERASVCEITAPKEPQNSGGPVQITKVTEAPIGENKIQVTFTVEHRGEATGTFYTHNTDCDDRITNPDKYVVYVDVLSDINGETADCTGLEMPADPAAGVIGDKQHAGFVRLFRGAPRTVSCTFDLSHIDSDFEDLFEVKMSYRYSTSIEKRILVKDVSLTD